MTVETSLLLIVAWIFNVVLAYFLEQLCASYYPFLLSAKYYITIKNPRLRSILISVSITRSMDTKTAIEDRDKLPLCGCIYCIVVFPWLCCEIIILLMALLLAVLGSDLVYSSFMSDLIDFCELLFTSKFLLLFIAIMPIVHRLDYSIGTKRYFK